MNEKNRLDKCYHCDSENISEVGWEIYATDAGDVTSEIQYLCDDCNELSFALNRASFGEFRLTLMLHERNKDESTVY